MSIHAEHPFLPPPSERNPVRRFRGRLAAPVTVWTARNADGHTERDRRPAGLTVSSMLVGDGVLPGAEGDGPTAEVVGLVDPDSDLYAVMVTTGRVAVSLLTSAHRQLADALAGTGPAPGGPFRLGSWTDTAWGPVLTDAAGWLGADLVRPPEPAGWAYLVRAEIRRLDVDDAADPLAVVRGRYVDL